MRKIFLLLFVSVISASVLVGCGGGGGGGGGGGVSTQNYSITEGTLRIYQPGDTVGYKGHYLGQYYDGSSKVDENITGYSNYSVSQQQYTDLPHLMTETLVINIQEQTIVESENYAQNVDGAIFTYRDGDNYFYNYPNGVVEMYAPLQVGQSWNYNFAAINYDDLFVGRPAQVDYTGTFTVVGTEVVNTVMGNFESFKIVFSIKADPYYTAPVDKDNIEESGTMWVYPPIGVIKYDSNSVVDFGYYIDLSFELTDVNFDIPEPDSE